MKRAARRPAGDWSLRFARGVALWLLPAALLWTLATPFYNVFLTESAENLVRLTERPAVTVLHVHDEHHFVISRSDQPSSRGWLYSVRTTDVHFPLIMLIAFFLAVPGVPWRQRLENLGWALLIAVFFHILSLFLWVKFAYATQLGSWSLENYSAWQRNFWGMAKHLADLPFKFAMPLLLWAGFYLRQLMASGTANPPRS